MKKISAALAVTLAASAGLSQAQMGRTLDWPTYGNDPQRSGWEKSDARFTKDDVAKNFHLLSKVKPSQTPKGPAMLMPPVIIGNLIGYRGFKELAFIAGSDDSLQVMDVDLNRQYWQRKFDYQASVPKSASCASGTMTMPTLMPIAFRRPAPRPPAGTAAATTPIAPTTPAPKPPPNPMFGPRAIYIVTSDGRLHRVNVANGEDAAPAVPVLPPNAKASTLNINNSVIYTTTSSGCGDAPNAVWSIDLSNADPTQQVPVHSFKTDAPFVGLGGPVIGTDGTVFVQTTKSLLALTPGDLTLKGTFQDATSAATPVVFNWKEHEHIVTAGKDGRLYLLDAATMQAAAKSDVVTGAGASLWGGLSSFEESDGTRWVLASMWGKPASGGDAPHGSIVAFKLTMNDGTPTFTTAWTSRDLVKPAPPVIANGVVFALSNGEAAGKNNAVLYALDAATGKELWSTKNEVTAPGNLTGLTLANGRIYFATTDNTVWIYGVPLEI